ncbi:MAG: CHAP domain-containing protein [Nitrospirae bacterium]|nr:MAG: CHAP domain-containing protein [Nitrospirota bacterium]
MTYQSFKSEWNGRRIDYDHVYAYQCVDLILEWCKENGFPSGIWGNAIDYANRPSPTFVQHFSRVSDYKPGDVVVLYGLSGNPYGHIGLFDHKDASGIWLLEQNAMGGGNGIGKNAIGVYRAISLSRVAAIYRLKSVVPPPAPSPARQTVTLPGSVQSWRLYKVGSGLRPNTSDQIATLAPAQFGGLTYKVEAWVGDYAVVIQTQMFGRGVIWVKNTPAIIK